MEYERIHQVQTGGISPSKLRIKLMGPHHQKKKEGSNSNSSRTSPSKLNEDSELFNNSLLETANGDFEEEQQQQVARNFPKTDPTDDNLDYDSNASSSSFEFHKGGERSLHHSMAVRSFSRPIPSKWNNAEKWIMNRQISNQFNFSKKTHNPNQVQTNHRSSMSNLVRVVPESSNQHSDQSIKRVDLSVPNGENPIIDLSPVKDLSDIVPAIRSVCMRDMGTEMTPVPSQEPSRSVTPVSSTTPIRSSPTSSLPTTPRRGTGDENCKKELSEEEMKMKTRREIVALGVHLGKLNIAAWASKDEEDKTANSQSEKMEFEKRAAAWEEAENSKHAASYKREEIKIEAWESQQRAKLEDKMRRMGGENGANEGGIKIEDIKEDWDGKAKIGRETSWGRSQETERCRKNRGSGRVYSQNWSHSY